MMCQHFVEATGWLTHRNGTGIGFVWLCMGRHRSKRTDSTVAYLHCVTVESEPPPDDEYLAYQSQYSCVSNEFASPSEERDLKTAFKRGMEMKIFIDDVC